jgi:hypothetical protein
MHHYIHSFSSPTFQGWLMKKARTGLRKTWTRHYFTLELQQLRCYRNDQPDSLPISTFDLREYQLQNQPSNKPFTFQLIHQTSKSSLSTSTIDAETIMDTASRTSRAPSPDLYLQAENENEWSNWVDTLESHVGAQPYTPAINSNSTLDFTHNDQQEVDVLDKWLERYDLIVPRADRSSPSLISLAPSSSFANDNDDDSKVDYPLDGDFDGPPSTPIHTQHPLDLTTTKNSSSRFLGFLWTVNTKKDKVPELPSLLASDLL